MMEMPPCFTSRRPACSPWCSTTRSRKKPVGRFEVERPSPEVTQERGMSARLAQCVVQGRLGVEGTGDLSEVVADRGEDARGGIRIVEPRPEGLDPVVDGLAQGGMHGHRIAVAARDAARLQAGRHELGESGEVWVDRVRDPHRPGRTRARDPGRSSAPARGAPRSRGRATPTRRGDRPGPPRPAGAAARSSCPRRAPPPGRRRPDRRSRRPSPTTTCGRSRPASATSSEVAARSIALLIAKGLWRVEPHQVRVGDDAGDRSVDVGDGEVVDAVGEHPQERLARRRSRPRASSRGRSPRPRRVCRSSRGPPRPACAGRDP